jgi:phosphoglycerate dehydrogenase-like enzyme
MRIILLSNIAPETLEQLRAEHDVVSAIGLAPGEIRALAADREALVLRSGVQVDKELFEAAPQLKLVIRAGSGFDNVDLDAARLCGARVVRIPGPSAHAVGELTFGLMLAVARNVARADRGVREGRWPKPQLGGNLISGKVLGIVGAGNIGGRVGELGAAWDMRVLGCVAPSSPDPTERLAARKITAADFDTVISEADYLCIHTPLTDPPHADATRGLFDAETLGRMKPGAYLINTARGGIVDEDALYDALNREGGLAGAALDVHGREGEGVVPRLAELQNVVLTPHIGAMAVESQLQIGDRIRTFIAAQERGTLDAEASDREILV